MPVLLQWEEKRHRKVPFILISFTILWFCKNSHYIQVSNGCRMRRRMGVEWVSNGRRLYPCAKIRIPARAGLAALNRIMRRAPLGSGSSSGTTLLVCLRACAQTQIVCKPRRVTHGSNTRLQKQKMNTRNSVTLNKQDPGQVASVRLLSDPQMHHYL